MNLENRPIKDLGVSQKESFTEKRENLDLVKDVLDNRFGKDKLPKDLVLDMVNIRKEIKREIEKSNFLEELDEVTDNHIKLLMAEIQNLELKKEEIEKINEDKEGNIEILYKNGEKKSLGIEEQELLFSLRLYFDSYRLSYNASKFRLNLNEIKSGIVKDNKNKTVNFYKEEEKTNELISQLKERYEQSGFSEEEFKELIKVCDLKDIDDLPIYEIKIKSKIEDIFSRFMKGDRTKYVVLTTALVVPAFIQGYAPKFFADAFKGDTTDINQIFLYAFASAGGSLLSFGIQKKYKDFINSNYQKEGGISEFTAKNLTEFPPDEAKKFGQDRVKNRAGRGRNSYESVLNTISFSVIPTMVTLFTSALVLYEKSPILAGSTVLASGITIALNKYIEKAGKFWGKQRDSERTSEKIAHKLNEQLNAHMEIILAGEKDKFFKEIKEFMEKEKIAQTNSKFFSYLEDYWGGVTNTLNLTLAGVAGVLAGGSADKVMAAILYSGNINQGIQKLLSSKRRLFESLRNVMQMELMFNGYAEEEEEIEKKRTGVEQIKNGNLDIKNVTVELDGKLILDNINLSIPSGSMLHLGGDSGAGKTTLMKIISGYYKPSSGEVKFGDVNVNDIKKTGEDSIYNKIAYLSQFPYLFDDSIRNNLKFGLSNDIGDDKILEVLKDVGLSNRFSKNLDEKLFSGSGNQGKTSGGETSRIGLARILLKIRNNESKVVFLDEPVASVDDKNSEIIAQIINDEKLKKPDTTFIVISHNSSFVEKLNCNIKVKMEKGKILEE